MLIYLQKLRWASTSSTGDKGDRIRRKKTGGTWLLDLDILENQVGSDFRRASSHALCNQEAHAILEVFWMADETWSSLVITCFRAMLWLGIKDFFNGRETWSEEGWEKLHFSSVCISSAVFTIPKLFLTE